MHKMPPLANVSSRFGAPMGRRDTHADDREKPRLFLIARLPWVDGDYDSGGAYWGYAEREHIFRAVSEDGEAELFVRAEHIDAAKYEVLDHGYNATFAFGMNVEAFFQAYVTCALWASVDDQGDPLDDNFGEDDLTPYALQQMREDCEDFYQLGERFVGTAKLAAQPPKKSLPTASTAPSHAVAQITGNQRVSRLIFEVSEERFYLGVRP